MSTQSLSVILPAVYVRSAVYAIHADATWWWLDTFLNLSLWSRYDGGDFSGGEDEPLEDMEDAQVHVTVRGVTTESWFDLVLLCTHQCVCH